MDSQTLKGRLKRIRAGIARLKADCLIMTKPANVTYITGFSGDDSWAILLPKSVVLVTDSRYSEQATQECQRCRIVVRKDAMAKAVAGLLRNRRGIKMAAVEKSTSIAEFEGLRKHLPCRVKAVGQVVESARRLKDPGEVAAILTAAKIAGRAFEQTLQRIRPGLTENELAGILDFEIRRLGGRISFETIVAFGENASRPHHQPGVRKLRKNDTVLMDFGVRHNGYCCDITRCSAVGRAGGLYRKAHKAVEEARAAALALVRPGVELRRVDAAAKTVIKRYGLPVYGHGTGHGLGLEVHELPAVSNRAEGTLQAGDVITIEPAVYIPGRLGLRIEDDVLVTEDGCVVLSECCPCQ
ncbi:MAG: Xaa-Pro peptidase family protein [Sedimentisphaerales bacterium]|nr:Xaa-Pro peptidase family protein [Sedimentisphaerales bacterium]